MKFFKRFIFTGSVLLLLFEFSSAADKRKDFVDDEVLVKFRNGTPASSARVVHEQLGASVVEEFADLGWQRLKLPLGVSLDQALGFYKNLAEVEIAQPNFYYHLLSTPNDPQFPSMYGMQKISAPSAWDVDTGNANTVVAIIDTGIKYSHEDLAANMWKNPGEIPNNSIDDDGNGFVDDYYGYDFFFNDSDPLDENGHGTHTAGTVGAVGNNLLGVTGVNWNVRLMAIKIYNSSGFGTTSAMLINAYNYVRMMKNRGVNIRVTNNSYGGCDEACGYDQATKDAIDAMGDAGILNVFAAGNAGQNIDTSPFYPASYDSPSIMAVASSDQNDNRSGFSNFGATSVDVAAPGSGILSTVMSGTNYGTLSGTSMATPHVAGAAALLSSHNPLFSVASLKATLMNSVDHLPQWSGLVNSGGRLNISRALARRTVLDFDGDGRTDYSAIQNASGGIYWHNLGSTSGYAATNFGLFASDIPVPNDFDGDSKTDIAVWRNSDGIFYVLRSSDGTVQYTQWGSPGDDPRTSQDFDGDGKSDFVVTRAENGLLIWYVLKSTGGFLISQFGLQIDKPLRGDFDGDGKADIAVYRPSVGSPANTFFVLNSQSGALSVVNFGISTIDRIVPGDFDGDGKTDLAVWRTTDGYWHYLKSSDGSYNVYPFGLGTDLPTPGDYDGDGKTDFAVWRPNANLGESGIFYVQHSLAGFSAFSWGNSQMNIPSNTLQIR